jgi:hypothetical protein
MTGERDEMGAAPPDDGGHLGDMSRPDDLLQQATEEDGPQPALHQDAPDPAKQGTAPGAGMLWCIGGGVVLLVAVLLWAL